MKRGESKRKRKGEEGGHREEKGEKEKREITGEKREEKGKLK